MFIDRPRLHRQVSQLVNLCSAVIINFVFRKVDLVDAMLQRLEKYADDLESLVQQRTADLEDEKLKTEKLLYRMLPRWVFSQVLINYVLHLYETTEHNCIVSHITERLGLLFGISHTAMHGVQLPLSLKSAHQLSCTSSLSSVKQM
jgi:hypothetical protein